MLRTNSFEYLPAPFRIDRAGNTGPGSELSVVYNEERDTLTPRFPALNSRAFVVKVNRLFRF